jgi:hypothetical protein
MTNDRKRKRLDRDLVQKLFQMQPDNRLTPAQAVRRSLFPRWEVIRPAQRDPIQEEERRIFELLTAASPETPPHTTVEHPEA